MLYYTKDQKQAIKEYVKKNQGSITAQELNAFIKKKLQIHWNIHDKHTCKHLEQILDGSFWKEYEYAEKVYYN